MSANETLRLASRDDAPTLALMSRDLVESGLGWNYRAPRIRQLIDDPDTSTLVAARRGDLAGFAIMTFGEQRAHLVLMAVQTAYQRRGVGRRLFDWLLESAQAMGTASIHVELRATNVSAFAFYQTMGFSEILRLPRYYRGHEAAIRMLRLLRAPVRAAEMWQPPTLKR